ncbi:MAG: retropepsin-like aspartic protease [Armatimonadota bacterium]
MSLVRFNPKANDIRVWVRLLGPHGIAWCEMVLDTGSSRTVIDEGVLVRTGYDLTIAPTRTVATASGMTEVKLVSIQQIDALGLTFTNFTVLAMPLLLPLRTEGLLDFLRHRNLFFNFDKGILLTLPFARNLMHRFSLSIRLFAAM